MPATIEATPASKTLEGLEVSMNTKTGISINLPSKTSCPGKTDACSAVCYAARGRYLMNGKFVTDRNWIALLKDVRAIVETKLPGGLHGYRLMGAGDIFSEEFCHAVFDLVEKNPTKQFWLYTRSFAILGSVLKSGRKIPTNLVVFLSADVDNIRAAEVMAKVFGLPLAYMGDVNKGKAFDCPAIVNPTKLPLSRKKLEAPCQKCKYCFNPKTAAMRMQKGVRFPLH